MVTTLLLAALISMGKFICYVGPAWGFAFGEALQAYEDEGYQNIQVDDLGVSSYHDGDDLLLDTAA